MPATTATTASATRCTGSGVVPTQASWTASRKAPSGDRSPTRLSQAGISYLGSQAPARNNDGKKTSRPMALAARAVGATAAMSRPTANSAAAPSPNATTNQPTLAGIAMSSHAAPIPSTRTRAATSMARLTASWAISSIAGLAGVVDRRRRMPFSR